MTKFYIAKRIKNNGFTRLYTSKAIIPYYYLNGRVRYRASYECSLELRSCLRGNPLSCQR